MARHMHGTGEWEERIGRYDQGGRGKDRGYRSGSKRFVQSSFLIRSALLKLVCSDSIYTIPRASRIRAESQRIHICTSEYARPQPPGPTSTSLILPSLPERRENAPWSSQCRSTFGSSRRDAFCWQRYLLPLFHFHMLTFSFDIAPTVSPKAADLSQHIGPGANPYRHDLRAPQPQFFDLDLDLNPDL